MNRIAELLLPAIRWRSETQRYECEGISLDDALALGVGGFCFFGGEAEAARTLIAALRARSTVPLLIASDLERGAGQQLAGLTGLPPLAAIGSLGEPDTMRRAGAITARQARSVGIDTVFAPVLDLDIEPDNPIVGTRAIGSDPVRVAQLGAAWIDGCQGEGALACAKHFPGHGRTTADSHATLPTVAVSREELLASDVVPFRGAIDAGVASIMSCHVAFPSLDASGVPATLSREILTSLLRRDLGFEGLVVTDAMIMEGLSGGRGEGDAAVAALEAGCDLLLYPHDVRAVHESIVVAASRGELPAEHVRQSLGRRDQWVEWAARQPVCVDTADDLAWAEQLRSRVVRMVRGTMTAIPREGTVDVVVVDDDIGGPYPPPSRAPFVDALREAGFDARMVDAPSMSSRGPMLVALFGDIRAWKGRPGYSSRARDGVRDAVGRATAARREAMVVQFGHPRLASEIEAPNVLCAWGGESAMQQAAARVVAGG